MIRHLANTLPPLSRQKVIYLFPIFLCVASRAYRRERGRRGGRGAKSFYREEAWPSINHSILSGKFEGQTKLRSTFLILYHDFLIVQYNAEKTLEQLVWPKLSIFVCISLKLIFKFFHKKCCESERATGGGLVFLAYRMLCNTSIDSQVL